MDPAHIAAVRFCLYILNSALNKNKLDSTQAEVRTMATPFLQLLAQCLRMHGSANIVALSMRCICSLLTWNLPIDHYFSKAIGSRMLKLMFKGGVLLSTDNELVQACIKGLVSMFTMYNDAVSEVKALKASLKADKNSNDTDDENSLALVEDNVADQDSDEDENYFGKFGKQQPFSRFIYGQKFVNIYKNDDKYFNPYRLGFIPLKIYYYYYDGIKWVEDNIGVGNNDTDFYVEYVDNNGRILLLHKFEYPSFLDFYTTSYSISNNNITNANIMF
jgi:hypothetical protein